MTKNTLILFVLLSFTNVFYSQVKPYNKNPWIIGVYLNAINDSGEGLTEVFNTNSYNFSSPVKLSIEKRFKDNFGIEFSTSFNKFLPSKNNNLAILENETIDFFSLDFTIRYYLTNHFFNPNRSIMESFTFLGLGDTSYNYTISGYTLNLGGGINIFITEKLRAAIIATGKLSVSKLESLTNYLQLDFGLIYRI